MFGLERLGKLKLKILERDYVDSLGASQYLQGSSGHYILCMGSKKWQPHGGVATVFKQG